MALSNNIIAFLNVLTFLVSIPLIVAGIWLATKLDTECVKFIEWPVILLGIIILFLSLAGFIGAFWRVTLLLWIYLVVMFFIILALLSFTIFAFVVTRKGGSVAVAGATYKEHRLEDYSTWMRRQVENSGNWRKIRSCIRDAKVCKKLDNKYPTASSFSMADLSALQSGCCKPPSECEYQYVNPTFWINPSNVYVNADCSRWSNDQSMLCYQCDSCKAGVLASLRGGWRKVAVLSVVLLVVLVFLYAIGCCAFRNAQTEDMFKRYRYRFS